jgi:hypothetical protein
MPDDLGLDPANFVNADFTGIRVDGAAYFNGTTFNGSLSLKDATFGTLDLSGISHPKVPDSICLNGITYGSIVSGDENQTWVNLKKDILASAQYRPDVYLGLEEFFQRQGDTKQADQAFYEQNYRERWDLVHKRKIIGWPQFFWNILLGITVSYGRHPGLAIVWIAVFIAIGYRVFQGRNPDGTPTKMEQQRKDDAPRVWNAFWYSVDLFAPVIDLQSANFWQPKPTTGFPRHYMRIHSIMGWILIPILIAALTGIIK